MAEKKKTDAEALADETRKEEEEALDALEEQQLAVEKKARRDALRPHAKEEVLRRQQAKANEPESETDKGEDAGS